MTTTDRMRRLLEDSIDLAEGGPDRLQRWLQGLGLPPLSSDEEPYLWLLRGLSRVADRAQAEQALASWTADILQRQPDVTPLGRMPDRLLYNLFFFAAGLARPSELWEPLLGVYERRALEGSYLGYSHRRNLVRALSRNQADACLQEVWLSMATGEPVAFLEGSSLDGCWALVLIPDPEKGFGHPALDAIGTALDHQVRELEDATYQRVQLLDLCNRIVELHVDLEKALRPWFVMTADRYHWPKWAVEGLPSLFFRDNGWLYLWAPYVSLLPPQSLGQTTQFCDGAIWRIFIIGEIPDRVWTVLGGLEEDRRSNPHSSHSAVLGSLSHALLDWQLSESQSFEVEEENDFTAMRREVLAAAGAL